MYLQPEADTVVAEASGSDGESRRISESQKLLSYDVFDTVLARTVSPPSAVFTIMGRRIGAFVPTGLSPAYFAVIRRDAEERARKWHGCATSLQHVYNEIQDSLGLCARCAKRIMDIELEVEREVLYPVPEIREALCRWREEGGQVVFTSDMYLPAWFIRERLIEHDIWRPQDRLYVSCEHGAEKGDGRLLRHVLEEVPTGTQMVAHVGNALACDVEGAHQADIKGVYYSDANPNRYERALERHATSTAVQSTLLAGASRYARLHAPAHSGHDRALRNVAAGVMAPVLTGFLIWLLRESEKQGLERLYFTSRDGQVLVDIADRIAPLLDIQCEMKYVYFSRVAIGAAKEATELCSWIWDDFSPAGGAELLARLGLGMEDIAPYLESEEEVAEVMSSPASRQGRALLHAAIERLVDDGKQQPLVMQQRRMLLRYLEQAGFLEPVRSGFVDVGWHGTVHALLNEVLLEEGWVSKPMPGFFFGLNARQQPYAEHRAAYFLDKHRKLGHGSVFPAQITTLMEMFCTADHGTVTRYECHEGTVRPVLEPTWGQLVAGWGLPTVRRTVDVFLDGLEKNRAFLSAEADLRPALAEVLSLFWREPNPDEASAWGDFPRELGQGEEAYIAPLANPFLWTQAPYFALYGDHAFWKLRQHAHAWQQGCLARTPRSLRETIRNLVRIRKQAAQMIRRLVSKST